jgi:hypothetical protein
MSVDRLDNRTRLKEHLQDCLLRSMPRILALLDKNPLSPTAGSFDRKYWHYKIIDFPCGMQQELVLPLAYVWRHRFAGNAYCGHERLEQYIVSALEYHRAACHTDGSLDDYFPFERAYGATAYALAALTETALLTGLQSSAAVAAMEQSGRFLTAYREAGTLANHLAIAALALINLHVLTGSQNWREASDRLVGELTALQDSEGWFREYEGCDLGYQTVTIEFLARRYAKAPTDRILELLRSNVAFVRKFLHPDGSLGGEYGSRNTYNFYPGGFAILSTVLPEAGDMLAGFLKGIESGSQNYLEDDGVFGHLLASYVTVLEQSEIEVPELPAAPGPELVVFPHAGLFRGRTGRFSVYGATTKGGVCKIFKDDELVWSDTGLAGRLTDGTPFCQNKPGIGESEVAQDEVTIRGKLQKFRTQRMSLMKMTVLRLASLALGWWGSYSNLIRWAMQKILIYNQHPLDLAFCRKIRLECDRIRIEDQLDLGAGIAIRELYRSTDCVNIHVVTSDSFQKVNMLAWERLEVAPGVRSVKHIKEIGE